MKRRIAFAITTVVTVTTAVIAEQPHNVWKEYLGNPDGSHYSSLRQINRSNVSRLEVAWMHDAVPSTMMSPLVVDNMAYINTPTGLMAVDAATGKDIWTAQLAITAGGRNSGSVGGQRGLNYWERKDRKDLRILVTVGGSLVAIDAATGKLVDTFGEHGRVDLAAGLERGGPLQARSPGRVWENTIILGSSTGEGYLAPPGDIRAFDTITGELKWVFHTIPHIGETGADTWPKNASDYMGGVDAWGEITVDEKRGIAYVPTAAPKYELYGGDRPGNNLYSVSILALDARNGKLLWHFQTVHHDVWDYDLVAAPQLVTVKHDGKNVDVVAVAGKNGFLYVFDRVTGKPLWPIEERPVPQSDVPGEKTSATQPFPTHVPPFARQKLTVDDINDIFLTPDEQKMWKERFRNARNEGLFTPPGLTDTVEEPGNNGGAVFFDSAADPTNGTVYVKSKELPALFLRLVPEGEPPGNAGFDYPTNPSRRAASSAGASGIAFSEPRANASSGGRAQNAQNAGGRGGSGGRGRGSVPYPPGVEPPPNRYHTGYGYEGAVVTPPWATMTAYDLNSGLIKWQTPIGDTPQAGAHDGLWGNMVTKSGVVITGGGLMFFAGGNDSKLYAIDKDNGKVLYSKDLPNGSYGVPAVYEVNGREYLLVPVAGAFRMGPGVKPGAVQPSMEGAQYIAFTLPARL